MKKLLSLIAVVLCLSCGALAQDAAKTKKATEPKTSQLTGCLSSPAAGGYTLTNGHYKNGVTVTGPDELKSHVGHQVRMKGTWSEDKKSYKAESISHVADTCPAAGSAGGKTQAGKSKGEAPKQ
jgi:hypothetical protein